MPGENFFVTESRAIEIRYDEECPPEIREAIQALLVEHLWILPTFIHFIYVRFTRNDEANLSTSVNEEYRNMTFYVHPQWLLCTARGRMTDVRHEFVHALVDHLHTFCEKLIDLAAFEDKTKKLAQEELRRCLERTTCDIEHMIDGRLRGTPG